MAEVFQVVGGAMATVDLAAKLYKEIERFRIKVRQADEVGREMADKYTRLGKTLHDIHTALNSRKGQLGDQIPSEGEERVWSNIRDSLLRMQKAIRTFKKELSILDGGRDINKDRKWIDRAIWQLKLNKRQPIFEKLEEAANTRIDELTLSLSSLQIFMHISTNQMHTETNQYIQDLCERVRSIETSLRHMSTTGKSPVIGGFRTTQYRGTSKKRLRVCLQQAHVAIIEGRKGMAPSPKSYQRSDARVDSVTAETDNQSLWADTDAESMFEHPASPGRRDTLLIPPDHLPVRGLNISDGERSPLFDDDLLDDEDEDYDDDDDDDSSDDDYALYDSESIDSSFTADTNLDDISEAAHGRRRTSRTSVGTAGPFNPTRNASVASNYSNASCTGIEQYKVSSLMTAIKAKDASQVQRIVEEVEEESAIPTLITIQRVPILHHAVKTDAGPEVLQTLFASPRTDVNAVEPDEKKTALHWAVKFNRQSCCANLLDHPAIKIDARDKYNYTALESALHLSAHSDADVYKIVKLLLEHGARIPEVTPRGMSGTVDNLVKGQIKKRKASSSAGSVMSGADLAKAKTSMSTPERRPSDDSGSYRKRLLSLSRSKSAKA